MTIGAGIPFPFSDTEFGLPTVSLSMRMATAWGPRLAGLKEMNRVHEAFAGSGEEQSWLRKKLGLGREKPRTVIGPVPVFVRVTWRGELVVPTN